MVLVADENLLTRTALYVLRCHGQRAFPKGTHVHIINNIPLGRGLGSSGAAVVGGVMLANEVGKLGLSKARMLDFSLMVGMGTLLAFSHCLTRFVDLLPQKDIRIMSQLPYMAALSGHI